MSPELCLKLNERKTRHSSMQTDVVRQIAEHYSMSRVETVQSLAQLTDPVKYFWCATVTFAKKKRSCNSHLFFSKLLLLLGCSAIVSEHKT